MSAASELGSLEVLAARYPETRVRRVFTRDERDLARERERILLADPKAAELPDLNLYFKYSFEDRQTALSFLAEVQESPVVEGAYRAPEVNVPTPNLQGEQTYLGDGFAGIDALGAWNLAGAAGAGVTIADVEFCWNIDHEDLDSVNSS